MGRLAFAAAAATLFIGGAASAQACRNISVTTLAFDNYDVFSATPLDSAGTITYRCNMNRMPTLTISAGNAFSGGHRRMTRAPAGDFLSYDVYSDPARTTIWLATPVAVPHTGAIVSVPYYGRVFALQDTTVGSYTDTLIVTFNF
jgi:spore coat protein U-like protein